MKKKIEDIIKKTLEMYEFELPEDEYIVVATELAQEIVKLFAIPDVVGRSEQLVCPCCGSDKTYKTDAIHCTRCAVTTEI